MTSRHPIFEISTVFFSAYYVDFQNMQKALPIQFKLLKKFLYRLLRVCWHQMVLNDLQSAMGLKQSP